MSITWEILKQKTYEQAETLFNQSLITEKQWADYRRLWRNSCYRYSTLAKEFQE